MTDGLFGIIIGFIFGSFVTMLLLAVYLGSFEEDNDLYDDIY